MRPKHVFAIYIKLSDKKFPACTQLLRFDKKTENVTYTDPSESFMYITPTRLWYENDNIAVPCSEPNF